MEAIEERNSAAVEAVTNYFNQLKPQRKKKLPGEASSSTPREPPTIETTSSSQRLPGNVSLARSPVGAGTNKQDNFGDNDIQIANRRKLELEFNLEQSILDQERKMDDIKRKSKRAQQDIERSIDHENRRMEILSGAPKNPLSSTSRSSAHHSPTSSPFTISPLSQAEADNQPTAMAHSSNLVQLPFSRWPKISITPFDGDSRHWPPFAHAIHATVEESNMSDSYKLISLKDSLTDDIKKRMAHIFTGRNSYTQAWSELQSKYGIPGLIIQAHVRCLMQVPALQTMRDTVTSVHGEQSMVELSYSTTVRTLASKLPADLQREWGQYAYNLQPRIASLADFDKWIDATVGAEELRGVTVNTIPTKVHQSYLPRAKPQYGPTILNLSYNAAGSAQANRAIVRTPFNSKICPMLLAIVPLVVQNLEIRYHTCDVLDPGSEAPLRKLNCCSSPDDECAPSAIRTPLGWTAIGKIPENLIHGPSRKSRVQVNYISEDTPLVEITEKFYTTELFGTDVRAPKVIYCFSSSKNFRIFRPVLLSNIVGVLLRFTQYVLPITTRAKVLFQATWREKREKTTIVNDELTARFEPISWDDQLPATVLTQ
ncbi:hypothetical protein GHT06_017066 [Daphnia sinensis]|uniref:Uncharacterized protein n=1 Tax=Daphnia sinensis TaxID=1820382 RepID=A0AAD5L7Q1_9CRUS|nr:hypothetical protein GHT06_017066 [Daphnia sinensis]